MILICFFRIISINSIKWHEISPSYYLGLLTSHLTSLLIRCHWTKVSVKNSHNTKVTIIKITSRENLLGSFTKILYFSFNGNVCMQYSSVAIKFLLGPVFVNALPVTIVSLPLEQGIAATLAAIASPWRYIKKWAILKFFFINVLV